MSDVPSQWRSAFVSLQKGFVGLVKSTNKKDVKIKPLQTVTFSGLVRKQREVEIRELGGCLKQNRSVSAGSSTG